MERIRCHGVTVELPPGLSDEDRVAFCDAFVRETPEGLTPEEAALHVELFLGTHAPSASPEHATTPAAAAAAPAADALPED